MRRATSRTGTRGLARDAAAQCARRQPAVSRSGCAVTMLSRRHEICHFQFKESCALDSLCNAIHNQKVVTTWQIFVSSSSP